MRWGIGVITCERFGYLRKCVDSLYHYNPELKKVPLIIGDDASAHGDVDRMKQFWPDAYITHFVDRAGCSANIQRVYEIAEKRLKLDYLFFTVNDIACTRKIDFKALLNFMEKTPEAGQIQFMRYKGKPGDLKQERAKFNWTTRESIKYGEWIQIGKERIRATNYSYVNLPAITRLNVCDITKGSVGLQGSGDKFHQSVELMWVRNWYNTGLVNYETEPKEQPFWGLDFGGNRTSFLKV